MKPMPWSLARTAALAGATVILASAGCGLMIAAYRGR
jgi:hypothetical protein